MLRVSPSCRSTVRLLLCWPTRQNISLWRTETGRPRRFFTKNGASSLWKESAVCLAASAKAWRNGKAWTNERRPAALSLDFLVKWLQLLSYRAQVTQHGQPTFGEGDVELVFTADDDDCLIVWHVAVHLVWQSSVLHWLLFHLVITVNMWVNVSTPHVPDVFVWVPSAPASTVGNHPLSHLLRAPGVVPTPPRFHCNNEPRGKTNEETRLVLPLYSRVGHNKSIFMDYYP